MPLNELLARYRLETPADGRQIFTNTGDAFYAASTTGGKLFVETYREASPETLLRPPEEITDFEKTEVRPEGYDERFAKNNPPPQSEELTEGELGQTLGATQEEEQGAFAVPAGTEVIDPAAVQLAARQEQLERDSSMVDDVDTDAEVLPDPKAEDFESTPSFRAKV